MTFALSLVLMVLAAGYAGYFLGRARGSLRGFKKGTDAAAEMYTTILMSALDQPTLDVVGGQVMAYLSRPENKTSLIKGMGEKS